tara:strand:- start:347 stop:550 length:204 start_codon:yes stop_codon:yes gene_type:complete
MNDFYIFFLSFQADSTMTFCGSLSLARAALIQITLLPSLACLLLLELVIFYSPFCFIALEGWASRLV